MTNNDLLLEAQNLANKITSQTNIQKDNWNRVSLDIETLNVLLNDIICNKKFDDKINIALNQICQQVLIFLQNNLNDVDNELKTLNTAINALKAYNK